MYEILHADQWECVFSTISESGSSLFFCIRMNSSPSEHLDSLAQIPLVSFKTRNFAKWLTGRVQLTSTDYVKIGMVLRLCFDNSWCDLYIWYILIISMEWNHERLGCSIPRMQPSVSKPSIKDAKTFNEHDVLYCSLSHDMALPPASGGRSIWTVIYSTYCICIQICIHIYFDWYIYWQGHWGNMVLYSLQCFSVDVSEMGTSVMVRP